MAALLLMAAVAVVILIVIVPPIVERERRRPPGDGQDPATYGFDLTTCLVSRELVVAGQRHRDLIGSLDDPTGAKVDGLGRDSGGGYLVPTDRVIGVSIAGESRAYPLMLLKLHELVNDTLGGVPILVTYSLLCDSVVVFDRAPHEPLRTLMTGRPAFATVYGTNALEALEPEHLAAIEAMNRPMRRVRRVARSPIQSAETAVRRVRLRLRR